MPFGNVRGPGPPRESCHWNMSYDAVKHRSVSCVWVEVEDRIFALGLLGPRSGPLSESRTGGCIISVGPSRLIGCPTSTESDTQG